jgi:hypothetical protein
MQHGLGKRGGWRQDALPTAFSAFSLDPHDDDCWQIIERLI